MGCKLKEINFLSRLKLAYKTAKNTMNGRFQSLDPMGFPVFSYPSTTGITVTNDNCIYQSTVFACIDLLSSVVASLPCNLYEITEEGDKRLLTKDPLFKLLRFKPNRYMTAYDYWRWNMECITMRGGFLSWKNTSSSGKILSLIPIIPDSIIRRQDPDGTVRISGAGQWGYMRFIKFENVPADEFFYANYKTLDGVNPISIIRYAAETIGLALSAEQHGANIFRNDATPPLVISTPNPLDEKGLMNMAKMWKAGGSGSNYGMPRFLDQGAKLERIQMSNEDAQYLESRRFQKEEICGLFRVPPHMVGDVKVSKGWSTLEQQNNEFLTYTLNPYLANIESAILRSLIPEANYGKMEAEFNTRILLRSDSSSRVNYYRGMWGFGAMSPNEIRRAEGLNARDKGDEYYTPTNMGTADQIAKSAPSEMSKDEFKNMENEMSTAEEKAGRQ